MLLNDDYNIHREQLHDFGNSNNRIVNNEFPPAYNWNVWRVVLVADGSEEEPRQTLIDAEIYNDEAWKKEVKEKLKGQMSKLLKPIEEWLVCGA